MGAGDYPAGEGFAGHDPVASSTATPATALSALKFDGASKDWLQGADGRLEGVHPIDQAVALSVHLVQGTIAGVPTVGDTTRLITHVGGKGFEADVRDRILTSNPLARLISRGDVRVHNVTIEVRPNGAVAGILEYFNMRLDPTKTRTATAEFTAAS